MSDTKRILVPIRYPLTAQSTRTLASAEHIADDHSDAHLFILHVNLFQYDEKVKWYEIQQAVKPILNDIKYSVSIRRGILVEEIILEEATAIAADTIVIGENQNPWWKRLLSILLRNDPELASYLEKNTGPGITIETV